MGENPKKPTEKVIRICALRIFIDMSTTSNVVRYEGHVTCPDKEKEKILHKGKSITGPKKPHFGKETPMMPCRTSAPFLLSSKSFERSA